jgi:hypothetical protein
MRWDVDGDERLRLGQFTFMQGRARQQAGDPLNGKNNQVGDEIDQNEDGVDWREQEQSCERRGRGENLSPALEVLTVVDLHKSAREPHGSETGETSVRAGARSFSQERRGFYIRVFS